MPLYSDVGFVIRKKAFGEYDYMLNLFLRSRGRVTIISKGARKPNSIKVGKIEIMMLNKFSIVDGKNLDIHVDTKQINPYEDLRNDELGQLCLFYISEFLYRFFPDEYTNINAFDGMIEMLEMMRKKISPVYLIYFLQKTLQYENHYDFAIPLKLSELVELSIEDINLVRYDKQEVKEYLSLTNKIIENIIDHSIKSFNLLIEKI